MAGSLPQNRGNRSAYRFGPTVSRRLRSAGFRIAPSDRRHKVECVTVRAAGDGISILVDLASRSAEVAEAIATEVRTWGMSPKLTTLDDGAVYVRFIYRTT